VNHAYVDFLLELLAFVAALTSALGAAMLSSYLILAPPGEIGRRWNA
jgi:hypothetical protein